MSGPAAGRASDDAAAGLPDSLLEAAAIWHARLREPAPDPAQAATRQAAFERWRDADPRHPLALHEAGRLWAALETPVRRLVAEGPDPARARRFPALRRPLLPRPAMAAAAAALLLVGTALAVQDNIVDRLRSDYRTGVGERAPLELADGSRITLNSDSAVAVDLGPARRHVRLLRGQAWFEVAPDRGRPFVVDTGVGAVRVTGTRFDVRLDEGGAVVSLAEGRVQLVPGATAGRHAPVARVALAPGRQVRLSAAGISDPAPFDRAAVTAWLRGRIVFYDTPLARVVSDLNRYRPGRIVVARGALDRLKVSGVFRTDDPDAALTVIENTLPVRVVRLTDYLVLLL